MILILSLIDQDKELFWSTVKETRIPGPQQQNFKALEILNVPGKQFKMTLKCPDKSQDISKDKKNNPSKGKRKKHSKEQSQIDETETSVEPRMTRAKKSSKQ